MVIEKDLSIVGFVFELSKITSFTAAIKSTYKAFPPVELSKVNLPSDTLQVVAMFG